MNENITIYYADPEINNLMESLGLKPEYKAYVQKIILKKDDIEKLNLKIGIREHLFSLMKIKDEYIGFYDGKYHFKSNIKVISDGYHEIFLNKYLEKE